MPRTKLTKNANKRNREGTKDENAENILRDFDAQVESLMSNSEEIYKADVENITNKIDLLRSRIPQFILSMPLKDLRISDFKEFDEISRSTSQLQNPLMNSNTRTDSICNPKCLRKLSKEDEGYLTEGSLNNNNHSQIMRNIGVLSSASSKLRRSKSHCSSSALLHPHGITSTSKKLIHIKNRMTPAPFESAKHNSRPRFRTPITAQRAFSAEGSLEPIAILRYAKVGEQVISLSGSPVIASNLIHDTANVNIPITNGIMSLRPTKMESIDRDFIRKIDCETLSHLKQLQSNLNLIMRMAED